MYDQISMFNSSGSRLSNDAFTIGASLRDALVPRASLVVCVPLSLTRVEFAIVPLELFHIGSHILRVVVVRLLLKSPPPPRLMHS